VLLGMPTPESSELYALTVTEGDPSWAGPLAGVAMNLPVYHVLEPEVKAAVPEETYEQEVGFAIFSVDGDAVSEAVRKVRDQQAQNG
jgi:glycine/sarcosine/betaine reductase complex component A